MPAPTPTPPSQIPPTAVTENPNPEDNLIQSLFYSPSVSTVTAREADGTLVIRETPSTSSQIILHVGETERDLHTSLDEVTHSEVDFVTEHHHACVASQLLCFLRVAPYLIFQLQRVHYDPVTHRTSKLHHRFEFELQLNMHRYLHANQSASENTRSQMLQLRNEVANLALAIGSFENFSGSGLPKSKILEHAIKAYEETPHNSNAAIDIVMRELGRAIQQAQSEHSRLVTIRETSRHQLKTLYQDLENDPAAQFHLKAVLVHGGSEAGYGHYIVYLKPHDTWYCFSDSVVAPIPEQEVMQRSLGGQNGMSSAYCVIYEQITQQQQQQLLEPSSATASTQQPQQPVLADDLVELVRQHNESFQQDMDLWSKRTSEQEMKRLLVEFGSRVRNVEETAQKQTHPNDVLVFAQLASGLDHVFKAVVAHQACPSLPDVAPTLSANGVNPEAISKQFEAVSRDRGWLPKQELDVLLESSQVSEKHGMFCQVCGMVTIAINYVDASKFGLAAMVVQQALSNQIIYDIKNTHIVKILYVLFNICVQRTSEMLQDRYSGSNLRATASAQVTPIVAAFIHLGHDSVQILDPSTRDFIEDWGSIVVELLGQDQCFDVAFQLLSEQSPDYSAQILQNFRPYLFPTPPTDPKILDKFSFETLRFQDKYQRYFEDPNKANVATPTAIMPSYVA
eukprot:c11320_g1_i1.p1 GENE.c11320_g1_i1~~c11320_g1_i1.p1  ORF type:complete len:704 (+),score=179.74 c11320_g1_i1:73-2112(+)